MKVVHKRSGRPIPIGEKIVSQHTGGAYSLLGIEYSEGYWQVIVQEWYEKDGTKTVQFASVFNLEIIQ